jgi:NAD-dependent deacetylase
MASNQSENLSKELVSALRSAQAVTVLTGAGISAESGIPTYRDSQTGMWAKYDPHELATPQAFSRNPDLVMDWYRWRCSLVEKAVPNPGHRALVDMERQVPRFTLITQNVDGLHAQAGSQNVVELHGNIRRLRCSTTSCSYTQAGWSTDPLPVCPHCSRLLRPDVVWFGESLPTQALENAIQASRSCDVFFSIGTSGVVEPAASLPFEALRSGAVVIEINPQPTPLSVYTNYYFGFPAGEFLPILLAETWPNTCRD